MFVKLVELKAKLATIQTYRATYTVVAIESALRVEAETRAFVDEMIATVVSEAGEQEEPDREPEQEGNLYMD